MLKRNSIGLMPLALSWIIGLGGCASVPGSTDVTIPDVVTTVASTDPTTTTAPNTEVEETTTTTTVPTLQSLVYEEVAQLDFPTAMAATLRGQILVATKDGQVLLFPDLIEVLDISEKVTNSGEQGLLGLTVHPTDESLVYLHYSGDDGETVLSESRISRTGVIDSGSERILLTVDQPASNHNGGDIHFGPDGYLYLALGDGGGANDRYRNGQNIDTLFGGIARIDVSPAGESPYRIPSDNPFVGTDGADELWVHGLRNPWRFWFDEDLIYIAEVGQARYEEINVVPLTPGQNFGWSIAEGLHCFRPETGCDTSGMVSPVVEINHGDGSTCSVTGGVVYRGASIPELVGYYLYSDFCGGYLRGFRFEDGGVVDAQDWTDQVGSAGRVVSFGLDQSGEVYVLTTDRVLKLVAVR